MVSMILIQLTCKYSYFIFFRKLQCNCFKPGLPNIFLTNQIIQRRKLKKKKKKKTNYATLCKCFIMKITEAWNGPEFFYCDHTHFL